MICIAICIMIIQLECTRRHTVEMHDGNERVVELKRKLCVQSGKVTSDTLSFDGKVVPTKVKFINLLCSLGVRADLPSSFVFQQSQTLSVLTKPNDLLAFLEKILGTDKMRVQLTDAQNQLQSLHSQLDVVRTAMADAEKRRAELAPMVRMFEKWAALQTELLKLKWKLHVETEAFIHENINARSEQLKHVSSAVEEGKEIKQQHKKKCTQLKKKVLVARDIYNDTNSIKCSA